MTDSMDKGWHRITYPSILNHVYVIDDSCMQCLCHVVCIKAVRRSTCSATRHNPAMRLSQKADVAYLALRQAIMEQALTPGTKLPEDPLAEQFQISRTLVRAALARLASEGLIEMGNKRTATVAQPSLDEARAVVEVRRCRGAPRGPGPGRGRLRPGQRVHPAGGRVPHPAGRAQRQPPADPLPLRGDHALLADPGGVRPPALVGLRRQRTPPADRRPRQTRRRRGHAPHGLAP